LPDGLDGLIREVYLGLPGLEAIERISTITTEKWEGWGAGDEDSEVEVKERIKRLGEAYQRLWGADLSVQFRLLLSLLDADCFAF